MRVKVKSLRGQSFVAGVGALAVQDVVATALGRPIAGIRRDCAGASGRPAIGRKPISGARTGRAAGTGWW
ncbi:hypothetical protein BV133_1505 [Blastochloris viridis]|uniref:Uncharacterized protein n=1 Tax=Blastochloris viridis TaxID=1079 RepID=A0A182D162_BLAVI|nr:hypothetical protein BV133_1505 [Blastochloris viridis]